MVQSLEELATQDFSFIYPRHTRFLRPNRNKLVKHDIRPKHYRGLSLSQLRQLMKDKGIVNNFPYYLRNHDQLSKPVLAALQKFRWEGNLEKYPILLPNLKIKLQKVQFIRH